MRLGPSRKPDLSIIIPVYNMEKYLRDALDSVLMQKNCTFEAILVNDGSTDSSQDICQEYVARDSRFVLVNKTNGGLSSARNAGLAVAKGEYICYLDSDDFLVPDVLHQALAICRENKLDVLSFSYENFFEDRETAAKYPKKQVGTNIRKSAYEFAVMTGAELGNLFKENGDYIVAVYTQMARRDFLERHRIQFLEGIIYEDAMYTLAVYMYARRAAIWNQIAVKRRVRIGSIEHRPPTVARCYSAYKGFLAMIDLLEGWMEKQGAIDMDGAKGAVWKLATSEIRRRFKFTERAYRQLSPEDKTDVLEMFTWKERVLFEGAALQYTDHVVSLSNKIKAERKKSKELLG